ncbi:tetratricopeptide repeat protein [Pseudodesulfovibrio sediminis]|uniref:Tetratricopeptide repeat protein n=1 Tax=Pseudodesulfovibrio sediminis TaxID=2810563 RepID=A0ABM7P7Y3_9BACT|nr:tetratricopeptide repeat protein [Pseudodesulfovibrio sediminis]BCS89039.1 hypothetical protein PSDVSF_22810 [Pseudodesulfovibrio sediminis]
MNKKISIFILIAFVAMLAACSIESSPGAYDIEHARDAYSKGFFLEAEKDYERYLQAEPQGEFRKEAWERLGEISITIKGDLDRAVVLLEAMYLELGEDQEFAWKTMFQLGGVYAELGNRSKAIDSYEKCLMLAAESPEHTYQTQLHMARLYRSIGSYDLVAETLENCAESAQDLNSKSHCLYELAQSYSFIGSWHQARKTLEALLAIPDISEETRALSIFLMADIYEYDRDYRKTRELLESILDTYPNRKVVESRLASLPEISPEPLPLLPPKQ